MSKKRNFYKTTNLYICGESICNKDCEVCLELNKDKV
jgi:hypothetical protein